MADKHHASSANIVGGCNRRRGKSTANQYLNGSDQYPVHDMFISPCERSSMGSIIPTTTGMVSSKHSPARIVTGVTAIKTSPTPKTNTRTTDLQCDRNSVFPLPLGYFAAVSYANHRRGRQRQRAVAQRGVARLANDAVRYLNYLAAGGSLSYRVHSGPVSAAQERHLDVIWTSCWDAWRRGLFELSSQPVTSNNDFAYAGSATTYQHIRLRDLALPEDGLAASVPILDLLPPDKRHFFEKGETCVAPVAGDNDYNDGVDAAWAQSSVRGVSRADYPRLLRILHAKGMVEFSSYPTAVNNNGVFAVAKPEIHNPHGQRLITDLRPGNTVLRDQPWDVRLPNLSSIANLVIPPGAQLRATKLDISSYFHRLRQSDYLSTFQGLPPVSIGAIWPGTEAGANSSVRGGESLVWPRIISVPMGWGFSVHVAQAIFEGVIERALLVDRQKFLLGNIPRLVTGDDDPINAAYVDDYFGLGLNATALNSARSLVKAELKRHKLTPKKEKEMPASTNAKLIGGELIDGTVFGPDRQYIGQLILTTRQVLASRYVSGKWLERLIGRWVWALLCNRPALSVLQHSYRYIRYFDTRPGRLWSTVREELECLIAVTPFLYQRLGDQFSELTYCSDASLRGGGFTYCNTGSAQALQLARVGQGILDGTAEYDDVSLMQAVCVEGDHVWGSAHSWNYPDSLIARLEFSELRAAVRHYTRRPTALGTRLTLLCDNAAVTGAVTKGRSSSHHMNSNCRRLAACLLGGRVRLHVSYVPTDWNPADRPSRLTTGC